MRSKGYGIGTTLEIENYVTYSVPRLLLLVFELLSSIMCFEVGDIAFRLLASRADALSLLDFRVSGDIAFRLLASPADAAALRFDLSSDVSFFLKLKTKICI